MLERKVGKRAHANEQGLDRYVRTGKMMQLTLFYHCAYPFILSQEIGCDIIKFDSSELWCFCSDVVVLNRAI